MSVKYYLSKTTIPLTMAVAFAIIPTPVKAKEEYPYIIGGAIAIIIALGGYGFWNYTGKNKQPSTPLENEAQQKSENEAQQEVQQTHEMQQIEETKDAIKNSIQDTITPETSTEPTSTKVEEVIHQVQQSGDNVGGYTDGPKTIQGQIKPRVARVSVSTAFSDNKKSATASILFQNLVKNFTESLPDPTDWFN
jgi:hypothetical protein